MSRIFHGLHLGFLRMHNRFEAFPYAYIEGNRVDASLQRRMLNWLEVLSTHQNDTFSQNSPRVRNTRNLYFSLTSVNLRQKTKSEAASPSLPKGLRLTAPSLSQERCCLSKLIVHQQSIPLVPNLQRASRDTQRHASNEHRRECFSLLARDPGVIDRG